MKNHLLKWKIMLQKILWGNRLFWYLSPYSIYLAEKYLGVWRWKQEKWHEKYKPNICINFFDSSNWNVCPESKRDPEEEAACWGRRGSSPSAVGPPRLPCGKSCTPSRWTAEDEEVGRATWEQCRISLFWTAWMKLGKPDLSWIWYWWATWEKTRWASRGTKWSLRNRLLGEAGKSPLL